MSNRAGGIFGKLKNLWPYLLIALVAVLAYFLTSLAIPEGKSIAQDSSGIPRRTSYPEQEEPLKIRKQDRPETGNFDYGAIDNGAIPNRRVIAFKDRAAVEAFLAKMGSGVNLLGRLDKLNALLIGFGDENDFLGLLDGSEETSFIFPVNIPESGIVGAQDGAVALENGLLKWLGITEDNSLWGTGVKVAILDTGIADHLAFKNAIQRIILVPMPANPADLNGHGTAVATLIFSDNPFAPGIAPGATPISVRIADDSGGSNSFLIAQGIIAAVDAGAQLINISLGGQGNSSLVNSALAYARERGAVVVAPTGNNGREGVMSPAASPGVIAVGAVDAKNQHMAFSTTGSEIALSAVGYGVNVAYPGDQAARVSGTSFSAPAVTGTLAATMFNGTSKNISPAIAVSQMNSNLNDIGTQGYDTQTGGGVPDMWRIRNIGTSGIYDAAVSSVYTENGKVQVLVQNQGTETILNAGVTVNVNGSTTRANITTLGVGDTRVVTIPVGNTEGLNIQGRVQLSGSQADQRPSNDAISRTTPTTGP